MRLLIASGLAVSALVTIAAAQAPRDSATSSSLERPFVTNGRIRMDLSAGEYRIKGTPDNRIRLAWSVRDSGQLARVRARADVRESDASITADGPHNNFNVDIEIPMRADLHVRLSAGDLSIELVEGNKDISLHAGELDIDVVNPADYRRVEASIWAGELHVEPFGPAKEGLFRSFDWNGNGQYNLSARLKAGELRLHATGKRK